MKRNNLYSLLLTALIACAFTACSDDDVASVTETDANYVGKGNEVFDASEWYPGGKLGTTENTSGNCYSDEAPAVTEQGLRDAFFEGEQLFERQYTITNGAFKGLGPASVRTSCLDCHPNYGHGKRKDKYTTSYGNGNGYLLVIYHPNSDNENDGGYITEVTGMPQTQATSPFLPPIDENQIDLQWQNITAMESGLEMKFPKDGESFSLIYPELNIPLSAFNTDPKPSNIAFRLESTIGVIGAGLIDAIPSDSIAAQYAKEAKYFREVGLDVSEYLNKNFWDESKKEMASGAYYPVFGKNGTPGGTHADGTVYDGTGLINRFTYALTRASLQDGPGANAIWNITNVSRLDRPYLYSTEAWATAMSKNSDVIKAIKADPTSPYYADGTDEGIKNAVATLLNPKTNQFDNDVYNFTPDQTMNQFYSFLVWHRGLAIPRARDLNNSQVQKGKQLFMQWGCAECHRPKWQTTTDNYITPTMIAGKPLPRYQNQTIYPYSDFVQHKLYMKNDIHGSWCRTTPLWGRGLSSINTGAEDRLHDCRARNEVEAIMWHCYSKKSHAYNSALNFYNASKSDRDAVVKFLRSI